MGHKGGRRHLKRLASPGFWRIHRKEQTWSPKPDPGAHSSSLCIPLELIIRDELSLARNRRETSSILANGKVRVDGKVRSEKNYPAGLMDVVEFADANTAYRILPVERKGLSLIRIPKDEAKFKLCKILRKGVAPRGLVQYGTHDGRNLTIPTTDRETAAYSTNDTLKISIPTQRILGHIKFEKSSFALVTAGRNSGKSGKVVEVQPGTATRPAMVTIEDKTGNRFDTMVDYTFIVGTDTPTIKLEAS